MTSLREGLPNTIIEALACGVPVVSTNCKTGPDEILFPEIEQGICLNKPIYGEYGILMPVFSEEKFIGAKQPLSVEEDIWVSTLNNILDEDIIITKASNSIRRAKDFEIDKVISKWQELIEKTLVMHGAR